MQDGIKSRVLSARKRTQDYRPAHLNQPPIQYIQREVRQYTDKQTPPKTDADFNHTSLHILTVSITIELIRAGRRMLYNLELSLLQEVKCKEHL